MKKTKQIALSGVLCALGAAIMMLGGLIPLATFCCPALAGLCLVPMFVEFGEKTGYAGYVVIAALGLILSPDKESAMLFAFIGYYPVLKWRLDMIRSGALRILCKLGIFNLAVGGMYAACLFLLRMDALLAEYREMGLWLTLGCLALGNVALLLYDRMVAVFVAVYVRKFRKRMM